MIHRTAMLAAGIALVLIFGASNAYAFVVFTPAVHLTLLFVHILGAILFMGNIVVSATWMSQAKRTRDTQVLHFAAKSLMRTDKLFTLPGIVLLLVPGLLMLGRFGGFPGTAWVELALTLFVVSGIIWGVVLIPLQKRMIGMTGEAASAKTALDEAFYRVLARWNMWGGIATLLPFAALVVMVFKPSLWR